MPQFRAKARAVDLLGKGQISDLPTAISELWKNGYDAYGDNLHAAIYLKGYEDVKYPFFVIADDGKGMSREDILEKWIVLGTDSKSRNTPDTKGKETLWKDPRIKMGEKGIGRLSVAYLGSPMLMLTKKEGEPLQALYIDWRILENYNLYIEEINIPLKAVSSESDFLSIFNDLRREFLDNLKEDPRLPLDIKNLNKTWLEQSDLALQIITDSKETQLPAFFDEEFINPLIGASENIHGTKFIIFKPDEQLLMLSKYSQNNNLEYSDTVIEIRNSLNGLFNVFKKENIAISTKFLIISEFGKRDLIASRNFFTPDDYEICDHLIEGSFDIQGTFNGKIRVYRKEIDHVFRNNKKIEKTPYGPFNIKLGILSGNQKESLLSEQEYKSLYDKLDEFGGLYIYRDGFRVLPYGRLDADFLRFEYRRSKHAGAYFFSYRRMLGYIEITREDNRKLSDKAGREGFVNNVAYREFKADLEAFFIDLAKKYFGTNAESDVKSTQQDEITKAAENVKAEKEKEKELRKNFAKQLKDNDLLLSNEILKYNELINSLKEKQNLSTLLFDDIEHLLNEIEFTKAKIKKLEIKKPVRFIPTENQREKLYKFTLRYNDFFDNNRYAESVISEARNKLKDYELYKEFEAKYKQYKSLLSNLFDEALDKTEDTILLFKKKIKDEKNIFTSDLENKYSNLKPTSYDRKEVEQSIKILENIFSDLQQKSNEKIYPFIEHLQRLSLDVDEESLTGYYKIRYEEILKQWDQTKELAQMGIAVEIVDHQFNALYSQVAYAITEMGNYLPNENKVKSNYNSLKVSFEHLEDRYRLMSPLYRTTGKVRKNILGTYIKDYLNTFFRNQLQEQNITLESSTVFDCSDFYTFESILFPAFVNVVNNAIFWLTPSENRKIFLDYVESSKILILNSGVPIEDFYLDDIFKLFYSKKPDGRGIGLFLAKETLQSIGYDMYATNDPIYNTLNGACFIIDTNPKKQ